MYHDNIDLYLDEEPAITYRWLSVKLGVAANVSKQMLWDYCDKHKSGDLDCAYMLSGVLRESNHRCIRLVKADALKAAKDAMESIHSIHVYAIGRGSLPADSASLWSLENALLKSVYMQSPDVTCASTADDVLLNRGSALACDSVAVAEPGHGHTPALRRVASARPQDREVVNWSNSFDKLNKARSEPKLGQKRGSSGPMATFVASAATSSQKKNTTTTTATTTKTATKKASQDGAQADRKRAFFGAPSARSAVKTEQVKAVKEEATVGAEESSGDGDSDSSSSSSDDPMDDDNHHSADAEVSSEGIGGLMDDDGGDDDDDDFFTNLDVDSAEGGGRLRKKKQVAAKATTRRRGRSAALGGSDDEAEGKGDEESGSKGVDEGQGQASPSKKAKKSKETTKQKQVKQKATKKKQKKQKVASEDEEEEGEARGDDGGDNSSKKKKAKKTKGTKGRKKQAEDGSPAVSPRRKRAPRRDPTLQPIDAFAKQKAASGRTVRRLVTRTFVNAKGFKETEEKWMDVPVDEDEELVAQQKKEAMRTFFHPKVVPKEEDAKQDSAVKQSKAKKKKQKKAKSKSKKDGKDTSDGGDGGSDGGDSSSGDDAEDEAEAAAPVAKQATLFSFFGAKKG